MLYKKIDKNGYFIEDVILKERPVLENGDFDPSYIVEAPIGLYKPKWNGKEWIEGMSKKDIKTGLEGLLGSTEEGKFKKSTIPYVIKKGRKPRSDKIPPEEKDKRATFLVKKRHLQNLKDIAYWDRLTIKEVLATALEEYFTRYEKKHGEIKPKPKK